MMWLVKLVFTFSTWFLVSHSHAQKTLVPSENEFSVVAFAKISQSLLPWQAVWEVQRKKYTHFPLDDDTATHLNNEEKACVTQHFFEPANIEHVYQIRAKTLFSQEPERMRAVFRVISDKTHQQKMQNYLAYLFKMNQLGLSLRSGNVKKHALKDVMSGVLSKDAAVNISTEAFKVIFSEKSELVRLALGLGKLSPSLLSEIPSINAEITMLALYDCNVELSRFE